MADGPNEPFFKVSIDGTDYELQRLTLGDMRTLKREFGVQDMTMLTDGDPDFVCGMLYLCLIREGVSPAEARAQAEDVDLVQIMDADDGGAADAAAVEESPTAPAPAKPKPKAGARATPRKPPGIPS